MIVFAGPYLARWLAANESSPVTITTILTGVAAIVALGGWLLNKRSGDVTRSLGFIDAAQTAQSEALADARAEIVDLRARLEAQESRYIRDTGQLRAEVAHMREELAVQLRHHQECEDARVLQEQQNTILRAHIEGLNDGPDQQ